MEDMKFNTQVQIQTISIDNKPVLHMLYRATYFNPACFLTNKSAKNICKAIQKLWNLEYMGPPDTVMVDQGSNSIPKELKGNLKAKNSTWSRHL